MQNFNLKDISSNLDKLDIMFSNDLPYPKHLNKYQFCIFSKHTITCDHFDIAAGDVLIAKRFENNEIDCLQELYDCKEGIINHFLRHDKVSKILGL